MEIAERKMNDIWYDLKTKQSIDLNIFTQSQFKELYDFTNEYLSSFEIDSRFADVLDRLDIDGLKITAIRPTREVVSSNIIFSRDNCTWKLEPLKNVFGRSHSIEDLRKDINDAIIILTAINNDPTYTKRKDYILYLISN